MFSFISMNWRCRPPRVLPDHRRADLERHHGQEGSESRAEEDVRYYKTGTKVGAAELAAVRLTPHPFHGDWNYTVAASVNR